MSNPEIARRCAACGAAVRQSSSFCPQCGEPMQGTAAAAAAARDHGSTTPGVLPSEQPDSNQDQLKPPASTHNRVSIFDSTANSTAIPPVENKRRVRDWPAKVEPSAAIDTQDEARSRRGSGEREASPAPRVAVVERYRRPRTSKLRAEFIQVLDEAADDSGFRFIVISVLLFLIFVLLFVFSRVLE